jgi:teichoic acid transport system permease protein
MNFVIQVLKEQLLNLKLILRITSYDMKSKYQMHYLGLLWQFITPVAKIMVYWFVFGLGIRGGAPVGEVPYFIWLIVGLIPWFFISPTLIEGSDSLYKKVNLVSKMKFPVSVLPVISIVSNTFNLLVMMGIIAIVLVYNQMNPGLYLLQLPYYLLCMFMLLFSITLLSSTISLIIRDFQLMLQSGTRLLFFLTPILWDPSHLDKVYQVALKLNPFYYLIEGFRYTFLGQGWFYHDLMYTFYFWSVTFLILFIGAFVHMKLRKKFVDYL